MCLPKFLVENFRVLATKILGRFTSLDQTEKLILSQELQEEQGESCPLESSSGKEEMYIKTVHILEHPICACFYDGDFPGYSWSITIEEKKFGLLLSCEICKVSLDIPSSKFRARIVVQNVDQERKKFNQAKKKQENEEVNRVEFKLLEFPGKKEDSDESLD